VQIAVLKRDTATSTTLVQMQDRDVYSSVDGNLKIV